MGREVEGGLTEVGREVEGRKKNRNAEERKNEAAEGKGINEVEEREVRCD